MKGVSDIVFGVFIVNSEHITPCSSVFIVDFEQVNVCWENVAPD